MGQEAARLLIRQNRNEDKEQFDPMPETKILKVLPGRSDAVARLIASGFGCVQFLAGFCWQMSVSASHHPLRVFTVKPYPAARFARHWHNILILGAGYGLIMGGVWSLHLQGVYGLILMAVFVTLGYTAFSYYSLVNMNAIIGHLRLLS